MNKKTKIYAEVLEDTAMEQFDSAMEQDFTVQGALMPDAHTGYSLPIGAVVATDGFVLPSWVGYDIGCGMCATELKVSKEEVEDRAQEIFDKIYKLVPVGFSINSKYSDNSCLDVFDLTEAGQAVANKDKRNWRQALGSLGGGNHFIEIGCDENDQVWCILHSGSRGVGHGIAAHYMKQASPDGKAREGHHGFRVDSQLGQDYINDLDWALRFALDNRVEMISRVASIFNQDKLAGFINRNHNHAELKDGLWIHRKGATHAEDGMMGVIPGNMRDGSFIVQGKGDPDSLYSSSHGAGRVMGRKQAKRELNTEDFVNTMKGITALVGDDTLDEAPMAYKNIFEVMDLQRDLVDVVAHVKPIINIKG
jgi:tRNA-splicing ligase RtcB